MAVVFPREADFCQQANREGMRTTRDVLGYYSPTTNRILMFDATAGSGGTGGSGSGGKGSGGSGTGSGGSGTLAGPRAQKARCPGEMRRV